MLVSTSFLSSNNPAKDIKILNETDTDFIHVDVMDGKFVDNKTMPFREMKNISKYTSKRLDVHLMVENPEKYIKDYAQLNTEYITIHLEIENPEKYLEEIKDYGIKAGISIKPNTEIKDVIPYLPLVDLILIMSVEPGKGGQEFLEDVPNRIKELRNILKEYKKEAIINIDGGINNKTVEKCKKAKSDMVVSGSYILNGEDYQARINSLR
ncbi:MAG: ribulose-phosphate 3-epimerase [Bacilli bacterium]|nr:ribulose-phosphate 3-epimerase [Bacilli bacterium]